MKEISNKNLREGSKIVYTCFDGTNRTVVIDELEDDVKNGRPGFSGEMDTGEWCWGYTSQIIKIKSY